MVALEFPMGRTLSDGNWKLIQERDRRSVEKINVFYSLVKFEISVVAVHHLIPKIPNL